MEFISPIRSTFLCSNDIDIMNIFTGLWQEKIINAGRNFLQFTHVPSTNEDAHFPFWEETFQFIQTQQPIAIYAAYKKTPAKIHNKLMEVIQTQRSTIPSVIQ